MNEFVYRQGELHAEQVALARIAAEVGTPTYVYSAAALRRAYGDYAAALGDHPGMICYAVKANSNLAVLNLLARLGAGFDIVSGGELERVLRAGGDPGKIIFSGVGKTRAEMARALDVGIACFNVESFAEIERLAHVAEERGKIAPVSIRVNPDVDARTHPYISTGLKQNKFGIDIADAEAAYHKAAEYGNLQVVGIDCHIGSQLTDAQPLLDACDRLLALYDRLTQQGFAIHHLDIGGGVGVVYRDESAPSIGDYFAALKARIGERPVSILCEPGRSIAAAAGVLLMRVEYLKQTAHKNFAVVDAAMNDNIRPALYQAWQQVVPLRETPAGRLSAQWDIVGPVCESADFLARERELALGENDVLAMLTAGAYCFVMSSNYNSRGRAAEVLVDGERYHVVRQRESIDDLLRGECAAPQGD